MATFPGRATREIPEKLFAEPGRIWSKARRAQDGCWIWTGQRDSGQYAYGRVEVQGRTYAAHRIAFELIHGRGSAAGWLVLHCCDNRLCVNPEHLFPGSDQDNTTDKIGKGSGKRKLEALQVLDIRGRLKKGWTVTALALEFGVTRANIRAIRDGKTWKHLLPDPDRMRDLFDGHAAKARVREALAHLPPEG